jgi:general secretion pathway protein J
VKRTSRPAPDNEQGFTLVEMLVALVLLALISLAGFALIQTVLTAQRRTEGRLERLASLERAMYLIDSDFGQATEGPYGANNAIMLRRNSAGGPVLVSYAVVGGALVRLMGATPRPLIANVASADWSFYSGGAWAAEPPEREDSSPPDAVALTLHLTAADGAPGGTLRRVVPLTGRP